MTAGDQTCEVTSVPDNINAAAIQDTGEEVSNRTLNVTITQEDEIIQYELKISAGSLTEEEKGNMTENMKEACGGKGIEKVTIQSTNKDDFDNMAKGAILTMEDPQSTRRQKRDNCLKIQVSHYLKNAFMNI